MIRTKICERCGKPFETRSPETKYCCHPNAAIKRRHGMSFTPTHNSWCDMRKRCNDPGHHAYARYGGRGIKVCERWNSFENFFEDMGTKPDSWTLERIDNEKDYEPGNCKWATRLEQSRNRSNVYSPAEDQILRDAMAARVTYREIAKRLGKTMGSVSTRAARLGLRSANVNAKITDRPDLPLNESGLLLHEEQQP